MKYNEDGTYEIEDKDFPECSVCGKPTKTLKRAYGYFCEDLCELERAKDNREECLDLLQGLMGMFGVPGNIRDAAPSPEGEPNDDNPFGIKPLRCLTRVRALQPIGSYGKMTRASNPLTYSKGIGELKRPYLFPS